MPAQLPDPTDFHPWTLTEWVEAMMVLEQLPELSRTAFLERFVKGLGPNQDEIDRVLREVRRRAAAAPQTYPFKVEDTRIVQRDDIDATPYQFLLLAAMRRAPYRMEGRFEDVNPAFEMLTREALVKHLGAGAKGIRFAWPTRDGRPKQFPDAVEWLANLMGLEIASLADTDAIQNDGGLDVAVWRAFDDGHPGHLCVLAQCTVEIEFEHKAHDIVTIEWLSWIRFGKPPMSALVIPFVMADDAIAWLQLSKRTDLLLDRMRLIELLSDVELTAYPEYDEMQKFIALERQQMLTALTATPPADQKKDQRPGPAPRRRALKRTPEQGGPTPTPARRRPRVTHEVDQDLDPAEDSAVSDPGSLDSVDAAQASEETPGGGDEADRDPRTDGTANVVGSVRPRPGAGQAAGFGPSRQGAASRLP